MVEKKLVRTLLIGSFGAGNIGDEMILLAALEAYPKSLVMTADKDASATFLAREIQTVQPFPIGLDISINSGISIWEL